MKELPIDRSAVKRIKKTACAFMGLSHLLYLKDYVKGTFFALCELAFILLLPFNIKKIAGMITLGTPSS